MTETSITLSITSAFPAIPVGGVKRAAVAFIAAGQGLGVLLAAYGRAVELAYCGPFQTPTHGRKHGLDEDLEGRDPNW